MTPARPGNPASTGPGARAGFLMPATIPSPNTLLHGSGGVLHPGSDIVMDELSERERAVGSPLVPSADSEDADGAER
jgi:hypothetical protein